MSKSQIIDYTGKKFNKLLALKFIGYTPSIIKRRIWLFQCDCGKQKEVAIENVVRSKNPTKSCGCLNDNKFSGLLALQYTCFQEGHYDDGDLTLQQFIWLSQKDCHYCGKSASHSNSRKSRNKLNILFNYNGLDRVDNARPHDYNNVVLSCKRCNGWKQNLPLDEFQKIIASIYHKFVK